MKNVYIAAIVVVASLAGAAAIWGPDQYRISEAKTAVRRLLRDPESAVFFDVKVSTSAVCGTVNSKNAFGAMAGAVPFVVTAGAKAEIAPVEMFHSEDEMTTMRNECLATDRVYGPANPYECQRYNEALQEDIIFSEWIKRRDQACGTEPAK